MKVQNEHTLDLSGGKNKKNVFPHRFPPLPHLSLHTSPSLSPDKGPPTEGQSLTSRSPRNRNRLGLQPLSSRPLTPNRTRGGQPTPPEQLIGTQQVTVIRANRTVLRAPETGGIGRSRTLDAHAVRRGRSLQPISPKKLSRSPSPPPPLQPPSPTSLQQSSPQPPQPPQPPQTPSSSPQPQLPSQSPKPPSPQPPSPPPQPQLPSQSPKPPQPPSPPPQPPSPPQPSSPQLPSLSLQPPSPQPTVSQLPSVQILSQIPTQEPFPSPTQPENQTQSTQSPRILSHGNTNRKIRTKHSAPSLMSTLSSPKMEFRSTPPSEPTSVVNSSGREKKLTVTPSNGTTPPSRMKVPRAYSSKEPSTRSPQPQLPRSHSTKSVQVRLDSPRVGDSTPPSYQRSPFRIRVPLDSPSTPQTTTSKRKSRTPRRTLSPWNGRNLEKRRSLPSLRVMVIPWIHGENTSERLSDEKHQDTTCLYSGLLFAPGSKEIRRFSLEPEIEIPEIKKKKISDDGNNGLVTLVTLPKSMSSKRYNIQRRAVVLDQFGFEEKLFYSPHIVPSQNSTQYTTKTKQPLSEWEIVNQSIRVDTKIKRSATLKHLIRTQGIPPNLRGPIWPRMTNAAKKQQKNPKYYQNTLQTMMDNPYISQIKKDLPRIFPTNVWFNTDKAQSCLYNILLTFTWVRPTVGYCQALNFLAAMFLFFMDEELVFWQLLSVVDDMLPPNYYGGDLEGLQVDVEVFRSLLHQRLPLISKHFLTVGVDPCLFLNQWFMCLYINFFPAHSAMRFIDSFFYHGSKMLFRVTLALFSLNQSMILAIDDEESLMLFCKNMPQAVIDPEMLMEQAYDQSFFPSKMWNKQKLSEARRQASMVLKKQKQL